MTTPHDEEFSELLDADFPRIDLVGKAANGTRFLIAKSAEGGMFSADDVRDLIAKATNEKEEGMTDSVVKADDVDLDAGSVVPDDADDSAGAHTLPGSPEWEALDAAVAQKWSAILYRAKNAIDMLASREGVEGASGADSEGGFAAYDLGEACEAIDYALQVLTKFAADEQAEAELAADENMIGLVSKAMHGAELDAPLAVLEGLAPVVKAGRVLSSGNETAIRTAVDSLQKVLASLPAPVPAPDEVAKSEEATVPAEVAKSDVAAEKVAGGPALNGAMSAGAEGDELTPGDGVAKAGDDLSGMSTAQLKRQALVGSGSEQKAALQELGLRSLMGEDAGPAEDADAAPADEADLAPAAPGEVGEPADGSTKPEEPADPAAAADAAAPVSDEEDVAKASGTLVPDEVSEVLKGIISEQVKAETVVIKAEIADRDAVIKGLQDQLAGLQSLAPSKVLQNGALPPAHLLRGQDKGAGSGPVDVVKAEELRDAWQNADTVVERDTIAKARMEQATAALQALRAPAR